MRNLDYYFKEMLSMCGIKTVLAVFTTAVLLLLSMILTAAYLIGEEYGKRFASEADIAVFYGMEEKSDELIASLEAISGVIQVRRISAEEALEEMKPFLGEEIRLLERLPENPFQPYLRVRVRTDLSVESADRIGRLPFVTAVRNNGAVLEKIRTITLWAGIAGISVAVIVLTTCALLTYYVSAESILSKSEEIDVLSMLGAPYGFVIRPFVWHSLFMNLTAGLFSSSVFLLGRTYLPFETNIDFSVVAICLTAAAAVIGLIATHIGGRAISRNRSL